MNIIIRPYSDSDAIEILSIINFNILNSTSIYDYTERTLEQQISILNDKLSKGFPVIVAEYKGKCVGFGLYSEFRFREAYKFTVEHSVYVNDEMNGKGIGKMLLSELIKIAKSQNIHTMIAVIDAENKSSIAFHAKFDFLVVGIVKESGFKFNRWLDSVFMQLILE